MNTRVEKKSNIKLEIFLSPALLLFILAASSYPLLILSQDHQFSLFTTLTLFSLLVFPNALITLWLFRKIFTLPREKIESEDYSLSLWYSYTFISQWFSTLVPALVPAYFRNFIHRMLGAHIGKNSLIAGKLREDHLISIGDDVTVGLNAIITAHSLTHKEKTFAPIRIGDRVTIGMYACVLPNVIIEDDAIIAPGSVVTSGTHIKANEFWAGAPAKKIKDFV